MLPPPMMFAPGHEVDEGGRDREDCANNHEKPATDHLLADLKGDQPLVFGPELVRLCD